MCGDGNEDGREITRRESECLLYPYLASQSNKRYAFHNKSQYGKQTERGILDGGGCGAVGGGADEGLVMELMPVSPELGCVPVDPMHGRLNASIRIYGSGIYTPDPRSSTPKDPRMRGSCGASVGLENKHIYV